MTRGTSLQELVLMLRAELRNDLNNALGQNVITTYKRRLATEQERLYFEGDWPFMRGRFDVLTKDGQRYYDLPVDPERITLVEVKVDGVWYELPYGISGAQYNIYDSDATTPEEADRVRSWQLYRPTGSNTDQFEIWPIPVTDDYSTVRFHGVKALNPLTSETHTADLDDQLIVLYAAASLQRDEKERELLLARANRLYNTLKGRVSSGRQKSFNLNGPQHGVYRPGPVRVVNSS